MGEVREWWSHSERGVASLAVQVKQTALSLTDCSYATSKRSYTSMDITPLFNQVLAQHNAPPVQAHVFRVEALDEFVKEAYRIVGHVALHTLDRRQLIATADAHHQITQ